jgi:hypothetical protein
MVFFFSFKHELHELPRILYLENFTNLSKADTIREILFLE